MASSCPDIFRDASIAVSVVKVDEALALVELVKHVVVTF